MIENVIAVGDRKVSIIGMSDEEGELVSKMIAEAKAAEREACVKLVFQTKVNDPWDDSPVHNLCVREAIAAAIRARKEG